MDGLRKTICGIKIKNGLTQTEYNALYNLIISNQTRKGNRQCKHCNKFYKNYHMCYRQEEEETQKKEELKKLAKTHENFILTI